MPQRLKTNTHKKDIKTYISTDSFSLSDQIASLKYSVIDRFLNVVRETANSSESLPAKRVGYPY